LDIVSLVESIWFISLIPVTQFGPDCLLMRTPIRWNFGWLFSRSD
jgi:hypothetical protein